MNLPDLTSSSRRVMSMASLRFSDCAAGGRCCRPSRRNAPRRRLAGTISAWPGWPRGSARTKPPCQAASGTTIPGSSACFASGPWQASQATLACLPLLFTSASSEWQASQVCVSGELDRARTDVVQGGRPKVPVLAEFGGDDRSPDEEEGGHSEHQQNQDTDQVFGAPEEVLHAGEACNRASRARRLT